MPSALEQAKAIAAELVEIRRDFHRHPEVSWEEVRTSQKIADYCEKLGLAVTRNAVKTGVVATLNGDRRGPALALRADIDALPIQEENDVPYKSTALGKAHLCGHDSHATMLLGGAKLLTRYKERIPFPVRFIFQPAEEVPAGGATEIIKAGFLDGVDEIYGLHIDTTLPTGTLGTRAGPCMASMDRVEIEVEGVGGHGAMPNQCLDPVFTAAEIVLALQSIVSRRVDPIEPAVLSITQINAGTAFNIIPARVRMVGTARSLSRQLRDKLPLWIEQIAVGVAKAHGQNAKTVYTHGTAVLVNEKNATEKMNSAFRTLGGKIVEVKPTMGGEDFSFYLEKVPGAFGFVGACDGTPATTQCFHNPRFNIDENALPFGAALFLQLVCDRAGIAP
jgi:amidohydrolase